MTSPPIRMKALRESLFHIPTPLSRYSPCERGGASWPALEKESLYEAQAIIMCSRPQVSIRHNRSIDHF